MTPTLYLETNFLVGYASGRGLGRDPERSRGLVGQSAESIPFRVAVPDVCVMEAFSRFERDRTDWNALSDRLDNYRGHAERDLDRRTMHATDLAASLEAAVAAGSSRLNEVRKRLDEVIGWVVAQGFLLPTLPTVITTSLVNRMLNDPTDNLILQLIIADATSRQPDPAAFVSENYRDYESSWEVAEALKGAGVRYYRHVDDAMGWLESQGRP